MATVQRQLNALGFEVGQADGVAGPRTLYAIKAFQVSIGANATGDLTASDLERLFSGSGASADQPLATMISNGFEIFEDFDLPYGDYRSGSQDPGLKNISLARCQAICLNEERCDAFTYNAKYKFCFLKEGVQTPLEFAGAVSGRKTVGATPSGSEVATTALIARPQGCPAQEELVANMRSGTRVTVDQTPVAVGPSGRVAVGWRRAELAEPMPIYLMVSVDAPVRFEGSGLYALTAKADAAFKITQFNGLTRAVIPFYGPGAARSGSFDIVPLAEGPMHVSWDVVGMTDCGERIALSPPATEIAVSAGQPAVVFQNIFTAGEPIDSLSSPSGDRSVHVYPGYYRLYDAGGHLIAERPGQQPRFSLTGRFITAWTGDFYVEIVDSIDGAPINQLNGVEAVGWENHDSFFAASISRWALNSFGSPLVVGQTYSVGGGCHACVGSRQGFRFDLANNYALVHDGGTSLTNDFSAVTDRTMSEQPDAAIAQLQAHAVAPLVFPVDTEDGFDWQLDTPRPLTTIASEVTMFGDQFIERTEFLEAKAAPIIRPPANASPILLAEAVGSGGVTLKGRIGVEMPNAGSLDDILYQLAPITFAEQTTVQTIDAPIVTQELNDWTASVEVPDFEKFTIITSTMASGCSVDEDEFNADGQIHAAYDSSLEVLRTERFTVLATACAEGSAGFMSASTLIADRQDPDQLADLSSMQTEDATSDRCEAGLGLCGFELRVFNDRFLVWWSKSSDALAVYDGDTKRLSSFAALPRADMIADVAIDVTGRWLVLYFSGDLFSLLDLSIEQPISANGKVIKSTAAAPVVLEGVVADGELIVWNDNMRFDATAEGSEFVSVRFAGRQEVYALTQFDAALRQRGFLDALLEQTVQPAPQSLPQPPPKLDVVDVAAKPGDGAIGLSLGWSPTETISKISILQDGLISAVLDVDTKAQQFVTTVPLVKGTRWVTVVAQNAEGTLSQPYSSEIPDGNPRSMQVVAVGIDRYEDPRLPALPLAKADAGNMFVAMASNPATMQLIDAQLAVDDNTTSNVIRDMVGAAIANSRADETLVLFFSGHGISDDDGNLYLATKDTNLDDLAGTALAWSEIASLISGVKGRVVVFLDTCHSGIAGTGYEAPSDGAVEDLLTAIPSNLLIFSASKGRQFSQERTDLGGGVFTNALVRALDSERDEADTNANGALEISELYSFVRREVTLQSDGTQTPWFARNRMIGDFAVF